MSIYSTNKDNSRIFCFTVHDMLSSIELSTDENNIDTLLITYSYSNDNNEWSEFTSDFQDFLLGATSIQNNGPLFIKIKIDIQFKNSPGVLSYFELTTVKINNDFVCVDYVEMSESSDILVTTNTHNLLNPYRKSEQQDVLVKKISKSISDIFGFDSIYFRTQPNKANYTFQTYTLSNVVEEKPLRIVIKDNYIPDNKTRFAEFDIDFQDELELHIVKEVFDEVFNNSIPTSNDFLWLPLTNQMYQINTVYPIKDFMYQSTFYRILVIKYENRADIVKSEEISDKINNLIDFDIDFHADDVADEKSNATKSYNDIKLNDTTDDISDESIELNGTQIFKWSYNFEDKVNHEKVLSYTLDNVRSNQFSMIFWTKLSASSMWIIDSKNIFDQRLLNLSFNTSTNIFTIKYNVENQEYSLSTSNIDNTIMTDKWLGIVVNYIFENGKKLLSISIFDEQLNLLQEAADTAVVQLSTIKDVDFYGSQHYANIRIGKLIVRKTSMKLVLQKMLPEVNDFYIIDNAMPQINNL